MNRGYNYLSEINDLKDTWRIKVKIVRLWKVTPKSKPEETIGLEMVFIDELDTKIIANVKKTLLWKFAKLLDEQGTYIITNFTVDEYDSSFKMINNAYKIIFHKNTSVRRCMDFNGLNNGLNFQPFPDIINHDVDSNYPFDVIGEVISYGNIEILSKKGSECRRMAFQMMDLDRIQINGTMWTAYADELHKALTERKDSDHFILIIQLGKISYWDGEKQISSCLFGTKLIYNKDIPEIKEFNDRISARDGTSTPYKITHISSSTLSGDKKDWTGKMDKTDIHEIIDSKTEKLYLIVATIKSLQSEQSWYYLSCRTCNKKIEHSDDVNLEEIDYENTSNDPYHCKICKKFTSDVVPRFRIQVRVQDDSGSISLLLFDRDVSQLLDKSASDVLDKIENVEDLDLFREELNILVSKTCVFLVEFSRYNNDHNSKALTVKKLTDDIDIISKKLQKSNPDQDGISHLDVSTKNDNVIDLEKASNTTPTKKRRLDDIEYDKLQSSSTKEKLKNPKTEK